MMLFKHTLPFRIFSIITAIALAIGTGPGVSVLQAQSPLTVSLPSAQEIIGLSQAYDSVMVKGMRFSTENGLNFNFVLDTGNAKLSPDELKKESEKIIEYFLASLTTKEDDLWVNLSPFEKDRITSDALYQTEMGRDLLAQDYILKKITSSLLFPDNESGQAFWDKIHSELYEAFADMNVPVDTFHKIWIVPESVELFVQGDMVLITSSKLKVMLQEDYFALEQSKRLTGEDYKGDDYKESLFRDESVKKVLKEVIVPMIEQEVNHGAHFANLRQIFHSLILAKWFRQNFRQELLDKMKEAKPKEQDGSQQKQQQQQQQQEQKQEQKKNEDGQKTGQGGGQDVEDIYKKYLEAFRAGAEGYIREAYDPVQSDVVIKKYVTGGVLAKFDQADIAVGSDEAQLNLASFIVGEGFNLAFTVERILPVDAIETVQQAVTNPYVALTAGLAVLVAAFTKLPVGGIDLKTDEMKIKLTGEGFDAAKLKDSIVIDPTKIGRLVPTDVTTQPLPSIQMFLNKN